MEVSGQPYNAGALSRVKEPRYALNKRLDWHRYWSGSFGDKINVLPMPGCESRIVQHVS